MKKAEYLIVRGLIARLAAQEASSGVGAINFLIEEGQHRDLSGDRVMAVLCYKGALGAVSNLTKLSRTIEKLELGRKSDNVALSIRVSALSAEVFCIERLQAT